MFQSVRAQLTLWYTAILALVLITFSTISYALIARAIRAATDASLSDTAREFAAGFSNQPASAVAGHDVLLDFRFSDRQILVFNAAGEVVAASRSKMTPAQRRSLAETVRHGRNGFQTLEGGKAGSDIRVLAAPLNVFGQRFTMVVAGELSEQGKRLATAARALFLGIPLALIVAAAGGYAMARKSLAPVRTMSLKARQIGAETLDERIAVDNERDELGFLAITLNGLLERLQRAFESQRRFMADASHELRTPLSIIQGEADVALARNSRSPADYRESIEIMRNAVRKLTRIVQDLFLLARTDAGSYPINKVRFYLDELLAHCVRAMRSIAAARGVELTCQIASDLLILADEELTHRMILNLIDNAVKFTPPGGCVQVCTELAMDVYTIRVNDQGPGIPPQYQEKVFERFFRLDRRQNTTGAGLGLPIARWIAAAHGGSLVLERSDSSGSSFLITLPAHPLSENESEMQSALAAD